MKRRTLIARVTALFVVVILFAGAMPSALLYQCRSDLVVRRTCCCPVEVEQETGLKVRAASCCDVTRADSLAGVSFERPGAVGVFADPVVAEAPALGAPSDDHLSTASAEVDARACDVGPPILQRIHVLVI